MKKRDERFGERKRKEYETKLIRGIYQEELESFSKKTQQ